MYETKLNELKSNEYSKLFIHKIIEHEAYLALLNILLKYFNIIHVKDRQDDFKTPEDITIPERLKLRGWHYCYKLSSTPSLISIPSTFFPSYVNIQYIHINFQKWIQESSFENNAHNFFTIEHTTGINPPSKT